MKRKLKVSLANSFECSGCTACVSICPVNAIRMVEDKEGFLNPTIDKRLCIGCQKCEKTCPLLGKTPEALGKTKAYAAINKNELIRMKSSSGGVFYSLAKWTIAHGGVVFGARFDEQWEVRHDYAETLEGIESFMGSKYIQSVIGESLRQAKHFLEDGRWVLFSGTPCQLGGLRAFLGKEYEQLIQVDLICHGVPSPKVWRSYLKDYFYSSVIQSISFRDKESGWRNYQNVITTSQIIRETHMENPFFRGFLRDVYLRKSCYDCQYRSYHRNSDLTLGDYWGVDRLCPDLYDDKGTSIVFAHTGKGGRILSEIAEDFLLVEQEKEAAVMCNPSMDRKNPSDSKRRRMFFRIFRLTSFKTAEFVIDKDSLGKCFLRKLKHKLFS